LIFKKGLSSTLGIAMQVQWWQCSDGIAIANVLLPPWPLWHHHVFILTTYLVFYISLFTNNFITIFLLCSLSTSIAEHVAECRKPKFYVPASAPSAEQPEHAEH